MAKWADYLISHVEKNSSGVITRVLLHKDNDTNIDEGIVKTESEVIQLLKKGYTVMTTIWGYPKWQKGAKVDYVKSIHGEYLRTDRDKTAKDNLDNMLPLHI